MPPSSASPSVIDIFRIICSICTIYWPLQLVESDTDEDELLPDLGALARCHPKIPNTQHSNKALAAKPVHSTDSSAFLPIHFISDDSDDDAITLGSVIKKPRQSGSSSGSDVMIISKVPSEALSDNEDGVLEMESNFCAPQSNSPTSSDYLPDLEARIGGLSSIRRAESPVSEHLSTKLKPGSSMLPQSGVGSVERSVRPVDYGISGCSSQQSLASVASEPIRKKQKVDPQVIVHVLV